MKPDFEKRMKRICDDNHRYMKAVMLMLNSSMLILSQREEHIKEISRLKEEHNEEISKMKDEFFKENQKQKHALVKLWFQKEVAEGGRKRMPTKLTVFNPSIPKTELKKDKA